MIPQKKNRGIKKYILDFCYQIYSYWSYLARI
jgi:hypothetical protein